MRRERGVGRRRGDEEKRQGASSVGQTLGFSLFPTSPSRLLRSLARSVFIYFRLSPSLSRDEQPLSQAKQNPKRYEKYVNATDGGRGNGPDGTGGRDAFGEAHSLVLGKLAALQTRCDEAAAASDRAVRAGINADIR